MFSTPEPDGRSRTLLLAAFHDAIVQFDRRNGGWSDLGGQLQDGLLDVIAFAAGVPIPAVSQLEVHTQINIVGFTDEELAKVTGAFPVSPFDIPA